MDLAFVILVIQLYSCSVNAFPTTMFSNSLDIATTRLTSCLDLLLSTIIERITNIQISDSEDFGVPSDHKAITFDVNLSICTLNKNQQEMFSFKKADFEGLGTALRNDPPENYLDNDSNINDINLVLLYLNV